MTKVVTTIVTTFSMLQKIQGETFKKPRTSSKKSTSFLFLFFNKSSTYRKNYCISNDVWNHGYQVTILSNGFAIALYETSLTVLPWM